MRYLVEIVNPHGLTLQTSISSDPGTAYADLIEALGLAGMEYDHVDKNKYTFYSVHEADKPGSKPQQWVVPGGYRVLFQTIH